MLEPQGSIRSSSINAVDDHGRTALSRACEAGDYEVVQKLLLDPAIDISMEDDSGMSPYEYALKRNHLACAALVRNEAYYRANDSNNEFLNILRAELTTTEGSNFDERLFRQAVENDPPAASRYLDQFVSTTRHEYEFKNLDAICGLESVKTSALSSILNESIISSQDEGKADCLQHVVLHRVLDIKWELFAARKYYQQLLLFILMLMAMTNVVSSNYSVEKILALNNQVTSQDSNMTVDEYMKRLEKIAVLQPSFAVWIFTLFFCLFGFIHLRHLKPLRFLKLTRWMYDGKYVFDADFVVPHAAGYKSRARRWLFYRTLLWTLLIVAPTLYFLMIALPTIDMEAVVTVVCLHAYFSCLVLWCCALYFLVLEVLELLGEDPWVYARRQKASCIGKVYWTFVLILLPFATPFMASYRKYYASFTNKLQLLTYTLIIGPFAYLHYARAQGLIIYGEEVLSELGLDVYYCLGAFCTITLWMLSLQYLEVNKTAGYLLPILKDVIADVWNFLIFYAVFQCGLSCAYYFIFQQKSDSYKTLWASFRTTYFVMYGENGANDFNEKDDDKKHILPGPMMHFGFILRMFQCAVMVVLLLNLLLAMMNKTVDRNWEKLQSRALASYARAVLRLETMLGQTKAARAKLTHIPLSGGTTVLNPIFKERVAKEALLKQEFSDEAQTDGDQTALANEVALLTKQNNQLQKQVDALSLSLQSQLQEILAATQKQHRD